MNTIPIPQPGDPSQGNIARYSKNASDPKNVPQMPTQRDEAAGDASLREMIFSLRNAVGQLREELTAEIAARKEAETELDTLKRSVLDLSHANCVELLKARDDAKYEVARLREQLDRALAELTEAKACLGYPVPGDFIPRFGLKCGICEANANRTVRAQEGKP